MTPPSVQSCPLDVTDSTDYLEKTMTWTPPVFTDNVGVVSVLSNRQPGFLMDAYTSLRVRYEALDAAGNLANCTFTVTLDGMLKPFVTYRCPEKRNLNNLGQKTVRKEDSTKCFAFEGHILEKCTHIYHLFTRLKTSYFFHIYKYHSLTFKS